MSNKKIRLTPGKPGQRSEEQKTTENQGPHGPANAGPVMPTGRTGQTEPLAASSFADLAEAGFGPVFNGNRFCAESGVLWWSLTRSSAQERE